MEKYGIPTARAGTFADATAAKKFAAELNGKCAVKADGLALGKGVLICANIAEANKAIDDILIAKSFGAAGTNIVIQEFLEGTEISLHAICDGKTAKLFSHIAGSQARPRWRSGPQHRRHGHVFSNAIFERRRIKEGRRRHPELPGCTAEKRELIFGILYPGVMLTKNGPRVFGVQRPLWRS